MNLYIFCLGRGVVQLVDCLLNLCLNCHYRHDFFLKLQITFDEKQLIMLAQDNIDCQ